ncbi:MAG TPA: hypothetical protein DCX53_14965 [Anaerolineae bacterium]|nr:hypothetical protein [Anaerolineae bacterium]
MKSNKFLWISLGILAGISALAYLPLINKFGYFFDDWYLMYDVRTQGAQFFHDIFSSDRPGRAYLMIPLYSVFGLDPMPYNITAFLFRFLGGAALLWILHILWPKRRYFAMTTAILFTIYPGFLSQYNAIDYQSHIWALFFALLSVALTLKSMLATDRKMQAFLAVLSVLFGWAYLSQMEYFIGIEVFRIACIVVLVLRSPKSNYRKNVQIALLKWLPFSVIPAGFLFWRIFLFQAERRATDIGSQLGQLFASPLTGLWWLTYLIQDFFTLLVASWVVPLSMFVFPMRLQNQFIGFGLAGLAVLIFLWRSRRDEDKESEPLAVSSRQETREFLWVGLMSIVGGLAPVIAANRHIVLPDYSRYSLIASVGAVLLIVAFIEKISSRSLRSGAAGALIAIAVLTHYGNSVKAVSETESVRDLWWQVSWRAPQLKSGTALSVSYPNVAIQEGYFVWGPANHIYFPENKNDDALQVDLSAVVLNEDTVARIITGRGQDSSYKRGDILVVNDYNNVLVITQADGNSCVRFLDGKSPDLSVFDQQRVMLIAPKSKLENVITSGKSQTPPALIFGTEPAHGWCYYYQKADLARQTGDWDAVTALYEETVKNGLRPNDQIELMPFLQAFAMVGDKKQVKDISTRIKTHVFYQQQACDSLIAMSEHGHPLTSEMQIYVEELFCK